jgi:hypothetical protein
MKEENLDTLEVHMEFMDWQSQYTMYAFSSNWYTSLTIHSKSLQEFFIFFVDKDKTVFKFIWKWRELK